MPANPTRPSSPSARRLGVCSWSLRPADAADLVRLVREAGLRAVQLALDPVRAGAMPLDVVARELEDGGVACLSGMMAMAGEDYSTLESIRRTGGVVSDNTWESNLAAARENARIARELGIGLVTFHAGFLPHERSDPRRAVVLERVRRLADVFAQAGVRVALETGQETADTLLDALDELTDAAVGVNFDPANMILYGMGDPVAALRRLAPHVLQAHVKDAVPALSPGEWGREVPVGEGDVDWAAFFAALDVAGPGIPLAIEREAGDDRVGDVRRAREVVERYAGARAGASGEEAGGAPGAREVRP